MPGGGKYVQDWSNDDPVVKYMLKVREDHAKQQENDYSHVFRSKSRLDLLRISCIIVGIEFAYSAETAFVSPILLQIGVIHKHMTMVWGLSPLLGFFIAPILGSISDRCRLSIGRRRPLIIIVSMLILTGLLLVPYGKEIGAAFGDKGYIPNKNSSNTTTSDFGDVHIPGYDSGISQNLFAFIFTILGTILLDFNADICQSLSRAYLLDVSIPADHPKAISTYTILAGIGGTVGYALGGIDWESTKIGSFLGGNVHTVFVIVIVVFIVTFFITVISFREVPLDLMEKDELLRPLSAADIKKELAKHNSAIYYIKETTSLELKLSTLKGAKFVTNGNVKLPRKNGATNGSMKEVSLSLSSDDDEEEKVTLKQYLKSIVIMPASMRILCLTNLICWMGFLSYCLYFTDFVGEAVFGGDPMAPPNSEKALLYDEGVRFGCWGLSVYALSCSIYSMFVEKIIKYTSTRATYIGGILVFAIGMLILGFWPTKIGVLILSSTSGVIYATLFTMPYILVAKYHETGCFKIKSGENVPLKNCRGMGTDIAIISSMIFVAQFIISLSLGSLILLVNTTSAVLYAASGFSILAAISAMKILYLE